MQRALRFGRLYNMRDLGGHRTRDGRTTRWRRLYRSESLHALGDADREAWAQLGVRTVVDLRRHAEVESDGRVPEWARATWRHLPFRHRPWEETPYEPGADQAAYLTARYTDMAEVGAADVAEAVRTIADAENVPLVVHCVVGKDRTGIVCAMTLALLGVPDEDIAAEYALTSPAIARMYADAAAEARRAGREPPASPLDTPAAAMLGLLRALRARHGSPERYLHDSGLEPDATAALRAHLLDPG
jgi:protein tyrosine/serine phosphatase